MSEYRTFSSRMKDFRDAVKYEWDNEVTAVLWWKQASCSQLVHRGNCGCLQHLNEEETKRPQFWGVHRLGGIWLWSMISIGREGNAVNIGDVLRPQNQAVMHTTQWFPRQLFVFLFRSTTREISCHFLWRDVRVHSHTVGGDHMGLYHSWKTMPHLPPLTDNTWMFQSVVSECQTAWSEYLN